jgi:hypothetical protein
MPTKSFTVEVERLNIPLTTLKAALVDTLGSLLGESPRDATVYHIKLNECETVDQVAERLSMIFGDGAAMLLDTTLKECKLLKSRGNEARGGEGS